MSIVPSVDLRAGLSSASHWRDPSLGGRFSFLIRPSTSNSTLQVTKNINNVDIIISIFFTRSYTQRLIPIYHLVAHIQLQEYHHYH